MDHQLSIPYGRENDDVLQRLICLDHLSFQNVNKQISIFSIFSIFFFRDHFQHHLTHRVLTQILIPTPLKLSEKPLDFENPVFEREKRPENREKRTVIYTAHYAVLFGYTVKNDVSVSIFYNFVKTCPIDLKF